ncbi:MAG: aminotransferase class V-fold PLP-dependent enzyme, partial [Vicinamibacteria bacterium]
EDAALMADLKWERVFGTVVPEAQGHIARILDLPSASQIAFAPNTHEFVGRLLSCFPAGRKIRVVSTDAEFMSFSRQMARAEEEQLADVHRVAAEPFATFSERFIEAMQAAPCDLVFFSHVFFNSGFVVPNLEGIVAAAPASAMLVIDGYHGFCAVPTSLKAVADRAFYLAGGYKYAQSGEGACFLAVPRNFEGRPLNTGWFADFGHLSGGASHRVGFSSDGFRMMGATFDPSGLYRFNAVMKMFLDENLPIATVHAHVKSLQKRFLDGLTSIARGVDALQSSNLIAPENGIDGTGRFLTFRRDDARVIEESLRKKDVIVDHRGDRLRFGFGAYHDESDIDTLLALL